MSIEYDKYKLLELFGNKPIVVFDDETGIYDYNQEDLYGFRLSMHMDVHEGTCIITLKHKDLIMPIYDIGLNKVVSIVGKEDGLIIQQEGNEKPVSIKFKPNYALELDVKGKKDCVF